MTTAHLNEIKPSFSFVSGEKWIIRIPKIRYSPSIVWLKNLGFLSPRWAALL